MERGLRHARQLARIEVPQVMVEKCIKEQGAGHKDQNYAINQLNGGLIFFKNISYSHI